MLTQDHLLICEDELDVIQLTNKLTDYQGKNGAQVTFTGCVRDDSQLSTSDSDTTEHSRNQFVGMTLEYYPGMTESQLQTIVAQAREHWLLSKIVIAHRVGYLTLGQPIVFIGVSSAHRKEAFQATEFLMDFLKNKATFWKKEHYLDRQVWVKAKKSDVTALERWS